MEPVKSSSIASEKNLWQAEALLQDLADKYVRLEATGSKVIEKRKARLIALLRQDKVEQRNQSDYAISHVGRIIYDLKKHYESLCYELKEEIRTMTGSNTNKNMSAAEFSGWKQKEETKFNEVFYDCEQQLVQFSSELDGYTLQLNHVQTELHASSSELIELIKEDEKLSSVDRSLDIQAKIGALRKQIATVNKKAAGLYQVPNSGAFDFDKAIAELETELDQIAAKIQQVCEPFKNPTYQSSSIQSGASSKNKKTDELEEIVEKVKAAVKDKTVKLSQLQRLRVELARLSQLEKKNHKDLEGELARVAKQKARASLIGEVKTKQESRKQNLALIKDKITKIELSVDSVRAIQQKTRKRKQIYNQQSEKIHSLRASIKKCKSQLEREQDKLCSILPSSKIWYESIRFRIIKIRKYINFGNPFLLLFLPYQCYVKYNLGLLVRKDLIKVERSLCQFGIIGRDYLEQIDIFNRKNKKGQQLCVDILGC